MTPHWWRTRVDMTPTDNPNRIRQIRQRALVIAQQEIGKGETMGNNQGRDVWKYTRNRKSKGPWCAAFVIWCIEEAAKHYAVPCPIERTHGARRLYKRIGKFGQFIDKEEMPEPGDIVCWWRGDTIRDYRGHIGFVDSVNANGLIRTLEGNRGKFPAKVKLYTLRTRRLLGYARL